MGGDEASECVLIRLLAFRQRQRSWISRSGEVVAADGIGTPRSRDTTRADVVALQQCDSPRCSLFGSAVVVALAKGGRA